MKNRDNRIITYQARWDKKTEKMRTRIHDSDTKRASVPIDCIICKANKDYEKTKSLIISEVKLSHIIFPALKEVPIKHNPITFNGDCILDQIIEHYGKANGTSDKQFDGLKVDTTVDENLDSDDLLVRVMISAPKRYTILVYKVVEVLANFSNNAVVSQKALLTPVSEDIIITNDERIQKIILKIAERRAAVGY